MTSPGIFDTSFLFANTANGRRHLFYADGRESSTGNNPEQAGSVKDHFFFEVFRISMFPLVSERLSSQSPLPIFPVSD